MPPHGAQELCGRAHRSTIESGQFWGDARAAAGCSVALGAGKCAHGGERCPAACMDGVNRRHDHGGESGLAAVARADGVQRCPGHGAMGLGAVPGARHHVPAGWPVAAVRGPDPVHRPVHRAVRGVLPGARRLGPQVLQPDDAVHGRHAGRGAVGQPPGAGGVLGADQHLVLPAGGLLGPPTRCAGGCPSGAGGDRRRRARHARGLRAAGPDRRQPRDQRAGHPRRADPGRPAVPARLAADPAGRLHQERAVPVSLLAAGRHGSPHAGVGLPALGDHGQGRRVPADAPVPDPGGLGLVRGAGQWRGTGHGAVRRVHRHLQA